MTKQEGFGPREEPGVGSWAYHEQESDAGTLLDRVLGLPGDTIPAQPVGGVQIELPTQPINPCTHECLRGPCIHYWELQARFDGLSDRLHVQRVAQCNVHAEATALNDQNVYRCSRWWPQTLSFMPEAVRPLVLERLRKHWERKLVKEGYDFSWRTWDGATCFAGDDSPEARKDGRYRQSAAKAASDAGLHLGGKGK